MSNETDPSEVHSIAGKILELVSELVSSSDEVKIAALKIAAMTIEETKTAQFGAQMRAGMLIQYQSKR